MMNRRGAIKSMVLGTSAMLLPGVALAATPQKRHFVTLSFDDGFAKSSLKTAEIFEKHGLRACFNIVAGRIGSAGFLPPDEWHRYPVGDWKMWNELQERGHRIMPHGLVHADLSALPLTVAQNMIITCLDIFSEKLQGFEPLKAVFNFPYNRSSPELEEWLREKVMAIRTGGPAINPVPGKGQFRLTCTSGGEWNIDEHLNREIDKLLELPEGWLIYNTHGIDEEGWGPVSANALDSLLSKLNNTDTVAVVNPSEILLRTNSGE